MKKFNPEMKVIRFRDEDVIVTSGVTYSLKEHDRLELFGFMDSDPNNNYVSLNKGSQIPLLSNETSVNSVLSALGATENVQIEMNSTTITLKNLFLKVDETKYNDWSGVYFYNSSNSIFHRQ